MAKRQRNKSNKVGKNIWKVHGGFIVRATVKNPNRRWPLDTERFVATTSKKEAIAAQRNLRDELSHTVRGDVDQGLNILFRTFCATRIERRVATGDISSNATLKKVNAQLKHVLSIWGDFYLDRVSRDAVESWYAELCRIARGEQYKGRKYSPWTVRGWWAAFRAVMTQYAQTYGRIDPAQGMDNISLDGHVTYTLAESCSLTLDEIPSFMRATRKIAPDHLARFSFGMLTSRRSAELRPLRRRGPDADINWETGVILIRRSHTIGEPKRGTKTGETFSIGLPRCLLDVLREHADRLDREGDTSDLLFPGRGGRYESDKALDQVLPEICKEAGISKKLTSKFMRRTFHDLMRAAGISDLLVKSMGGHSIVHIPGATRKTLAALYSTIKPAEQAAAIEKMARLCGVFDGDGPTLVRGVSAQPEVAFDCDLKEAA